MSATSFKEIPRRMVSYIWLCTVVYKMRTHAWLDSILTNFQPIKVESSTFLCQLPVVLKMYFKYNTLLN